MSEINKIASWISEDIEEADRPPCELCGEELAFDSDKCTTPGCRNFLLAFRSVTGWLITQRDVKIEFDDIIDEGNYYAVFVPSPHSYYGANGSPYYFRNHFKYKKYREAKPVYPDPRRPVKMRNPLGIYDHTCGQCGALNEVTNETTEYNCPECGDEQIREPLVKGSGTYLIKRTHKTLTIHKENIEQLVMLGEEIIPKRRDPPYEPENPPHNDDWGF